KNKCCNMIAAIRIVMRGIMMNSKRTLFIGAVVMMLALLSAAVILAQDPTPESTEVPTSFSDNRINGDIYLSGLALYCEDETGNTDTNTFQNGSLSIWGVGGQRYIHLTVDQ